MQNEFWRYFNLVDYYEAVFINNMVAFKFGVVDLIRQITKLKSSPKFLIR